MNIEKPAGPKTETEKKSTEEVVAHSVETVDGMALNNKIVHMPESEREEALAHLSPEEVSAAAKMISRRAPGQWPMLDLLANFGNKREIIEQPEVVAALKAELTEGAHVYNIERIFDRTQDLPIVQREIFSDPAVRKGVAESIAKFVSYEATWTNSVDAVVQKTHMSDEELRNIAEEMKGQGGDVYRKFVQHFGAKRLYPELR